MHGWVATDVGTPGGRKLWLYRLHTSGSTAFHRVALSSGAP